LLSSGDLVLELPDRGSGLLLTVGDVAEPGEEVEGVLVLAYFGQIEGRGLLDRGAKFVMSAFEADDEVRASGDDVFELPPIAGIFPESVAPRNCGWARRSWAPASRLATGRKPSSSSASSQMPVRQTTRDTGPCTVTEVPDPSVTVEWVIEDADGSAVMPPQAAGTRSIGARMAVARMRRRGRLAVR
jgi:hypothetical protein